MKGVIKMSRHIHLSKGNGKIGNCINYSLIPGSKPLMLKDGRVLTKCKGTCHGCSKGCEDKCYAVNYLKRYHNTCVPAYEDNTILARKEPDVFFGELMEALARSTCNVVRPHVAGEFFSKDYMHRTLKLAQDMPNKEFYFYTKRFSWLEEMVDEIPKNCHPNVSIWHKNYENPLGFAEFIYDDGTEPDVSVLPHCPAVNAQGKETGITCEKCGLCIRAEKGSRIAVYAH